MTIDILMPALSPTMEEGKLAKWFVKTGDVVSSGDLLAEIETDKATMELEAVEDGEISDILVEEGQEKIKVNHPIARLIQEGEGVSAPQKISKTKSEKTETAQVNQSQERTKPFLKDDNRIFASPLARRLAKERGIDLQTLTGSGPRGRIIKSDLDIIKEVSPSFIQQKTNTEVANSYIEVPLDGMRKTIANRLTEAKQTVPHFYLRREILIDELLSLRSKINSSLKEKKIKISLNDFIIKACATALQEVPEANSIWGGDKIVRFKESDVAVAVAVEGGLYTPIVNSANDKTVLQISNQMKELVSLAKEKRLTPDQYQGGTFAISNLGMYGIDNFDAVINPPHGSILAVGAGKKKPIVTDEGDLSVATVMSVTLSVDHRTIDGALGATFLNSIVENLEQPYRMLA